MEREGLLSKYNEAAEQVYRIGRLWNSCHYHRKKGNLSQWNVNLDCVWAELSTDAKPEDEKNVTKYNYLITKYKKNKVFLYQILMKKEIFLRKVQNKQGKGTVYQDPDVDDM